MRRFGMLMAMLTALVLPGSAMALGHAHHRDHYGHVPHHHRAHAHHHRRHRHALGEARMGEHKRIATHVHTHHRGPPKRGHPMDGQ